MRIVHNFQEAQRNLQGLFRLRSRVMSIQAPAISTGVPFGSRTSLTSSCIQR